MIEMFSLQKQLLEKMLWVVTCVLSGSNTLKKQNFEGDERLGRPSIFKTDGKVLHVNEFTHASQWLYC